MYPSWIISWDLCYLYSYLSSLTHSPHLFAVFRKCTSICLLHISIWRSQRITNSGSITELIHSWESLGHQGDLMSEAERIVSLLLENNKLWHYSEGLWPFPGLGSNYQNLYQMQICFFLPSKKDELPPITFLEFQIFSSSTPNQSLLPKGLGSIDSTLALRKWNLR